MKRRRTARRGWTAALVMLLEAAVVLSPMPAAPRNPSDPGISKAAAASAAEKIEQLKQASESGSGDPGFTFSEDEVNSYLLYDLAPRYPSGVSNILVRFTPGVIRGSCDIDFDLLRSSASPGGMLGYLFFGAHTLTVEGGFAAVDGLGQFVLGTVMLDGVALPQPLVQFLVDNYLKPRYPGLTLNKPFAMPYSIDRVQVRRGAIEAAVKRRAN